MGVRSAPHRVVIHTSHSIFYISVIRQFNLSHRESTFRKPAPASLLDINSYALFFVCISFRKFNFHCYFQYCFPVFVLRSISNIQYPTSISNIQSPISNIQFHFWSGPVRVRLLTLTAAPSGHYRTTGLHGYTATRLHDYRTTRLHDYNIDQCLPHDELL